MIRGTLHIVISSVSIYALRLLALLYGLFVTLMFALIALYEGVLVNKPSKTFWHQLEKGKLGFDWLQSIPFNIESRLRFTEDLAVSLSL